jgi:hypothetical protein
MKTLAMNPTAYGCLNDDESASLNEFQNLIFSGLLSLTADSTWSCCGIGKCGTGVWSYS